MRNSIKYIGHLKWAFLPLLLLLLWPAEGFSQNYRDFMLYHEQDFEKLPIKFVKITVSEDGRDAEKFRKVTFHKKSQKMSGVFEYHPMVDFEHQFDASGNLVRQHRTIMRESYDPESEELKVERSEMETLFEFEDGRHLSKLEYWFGDSLGTRIELVYDKKTRSSHSLPAPNGRSMLIQYNRRDSVTLFQVKRPDSVVAQETVKEYDEEGELARQTKAHYRLEGGSENQLRMLASDQISKGKNSKTLVRHRSFFDRFDETNTARTIDLRREVQNYDQEGEFSKVVITRFSARTSAEEPDPEFEEILEQSILFDQGHPMSTEIIHRGTNTRIKGEYIYNKTGLIDRIEYANEGEKVGLVVYYRYGYYPK